MSALFNSVAQRRGLSCALLGGLVLVVRLALLPIWPIPLPSIYDEYSYLLAGDTFAHGRLANPPHALPEFFETIEVLQQPTYASRYLPGQGMALAVGQIAGDHPWFGVWLSCGLLVAALLWACYGWLPDGWAWLGPLLVLHVCFAGYWMNSYWGGAVPAIGGALMLGALGRLRMSAEKPVWLLVTMAAGAVILACSRPFEGLLLALPVVVFAVRLVRSPKLWLAPALVVLAGLGWLGFYNQQVTGSALKMPYQAYFERYETIPPLLFLPEAAPGSRNYGHFNFELLDNTWMRDQWDAAHRPGFLLRRAKEWMACIGTFTGNPLWTIPLLGLLPWFWKAREIRFVAGLFAFILLATFSEPGLFAHYVAPFTAVIAILLAWSVRHLRAVGVVFCLLLSTYTWGNFAMKVLRGTTPDKFRSANAFSQRLEEKLPDDRGHVIFVHYTLPKVPHAEWIHNSANIDGQRVIWAQDMGPEKNRALQAWYPDRHFWYFEPDEPNPAPRPYAP